MQEGPFDEVALVVRKPPKSTLWVWGLKLGGGFGFGLLPRVLWGSIIRSP